MVVKDLIPVPVEELAEEEEGCSGLAPRLLAPDLDKLQPINLVGSVHFAEDFLRPVPRLL